MPSFHLSWLVLLSVSCVPSAVAHGRGPDPTDRTVDDVVRDTEQASARVGSLEWTCTYVELVNGQLPSGAAPGKCKTIFSPADGRYRVVTEQVVFDPGSPPQGQWEIRAFDGKQTWQHFRASKNAQIPIPIPGSHIEDTNRPDIASIESAEQGQASMTVTGLGYVLGMTSAGRLSDAVARARHEKRAVSWSAGPVDSIDVVTIQSPEERWAFRFYFDREKGCLSGEETIDVENNNAVTLKTVIEHFRQGAVWLPRRVHQRNLFGGYESTIEYKDWIFNKPIHDSTFRIAFAPGTTVNDTISGRTFVVGTPSEAESQAIRDSVHDRKLRAGAESHGVFGRTGVWVVAVFITAALSWSAIRRWRRPPFRSGR